MNPRFQALQTLQQRPAPQPITEQRRASEIFGELVFNKKQMKHHLSNEVYKQLVAAMERGKKIDREIAEPVANAIKSWAMDLGATHYTHWFQPLTGLAAEKHDSFLEFSDDEPIDKFSGSELVQQEPDASSFPNGGLRSTFEARGYTAWDASSPVFIFDSPYGRTLCIPTIFVSYTGESLDYKIPLLKSMKALDEAATSVCQLFDESVKRVTATLGAEQEYFLVDEAYANLRPDLVLGGRTLFGAPPARGQQLDDHYFGAIPQRAFAFMNELEHECLRLGIPLKTRHNEVAPGQFECAPRFQELNIAIDQGQLLMDLIDRIGRKHHLRALLHEKPFARINGSGKHNNWSIATEKGKNLLSPGSDPRENLQFLVFFTSVVRAVHEHAALLRASIGSAGNDHRLGANEAPPAIISVFLGSQLSKVLDDIVEPPRKRRNAPTNPYLELGISKIPELFLDNTDRNRTSPFAFTGNKFEFRAVGSSTNSARAMIVLNTAVADRLVQLQQSVDRKVKRGRKLESALLDVIKENIKESKAVRFEGDGYSQEWVEEAERRGLPNIKKTAHAMDAYLTEEAAALFERHDVFTKPELHARYEVLIENYLNKVMIEADLMGEMLMTQIVPAAVTYLDELEDAGTAGTKRLIKRIGEYLDAALEGEEKLREARKKAEKKEQVGDQAKAYADEVVPLFETIREAVDELEQLLPDNLWPLPKYREMLFIR